MAGEFRDFSRREPVQHDAEHPGQQNTGKKRRHGHQQLIAHRTDAVQRALPSGAAHPQRNGHRNDQHKAQQRQGQRQRGLLCHQLRHGYVIAVRCAQISGEKARRPGEIPHRQRPVQTHFLPQGGDLRGGGLRAQQKLRRVTVNQRECHKRKKRDDHHAVHLQHPDGFHFTRREKELQ